MNSLDSLGDVFGAYYNGADETWGHGSGPGSDPSYTIGYRAFLDKFIWLNRVATVVDVGCGDFQFSRFLNLDRIEYLGFDVVPVVIERNTKAFSRKNVRFSMMPERKDLLPGGDLLIMKDVLQHLPIPEILEFSARVFPKFKYCLLTNSFRKLNTKVNHEIAPGGFRCLDFTAAPFKFRGSYVFDFPSPAWEELRTFLMMP